jgi:pyridoxine/pyridoxamine 5'-phosphate oxidase
VVHDQSYRWDNTGVEAMDQNLMAAIRALLASCVDMTIATVREDGYPQATTVSYVSDGLKIYFGCNAASQKARNLARNAKVSLTINAPYKTWGEIRGLSVGGVAKRVQDGAELARMQQLMIAKFPQITQYAGDGSYELAAFRVTPQVISLLDYAKGFGHTDFVTMPADAVS